MGAGQAVIDSIHWVIFPGRMTDGNTRPLSWLAVHLDGAAGSKKKEQALVYV